MLGARKVVNSQFEPVQDIVFHDVLWVVWIVYFVHRNCRITLQQNHTLMTTLCQESFIKAASTVLWRIEGHQIRGHAMQSPTKIWWVKGLRFSPEAYQPA